MYDMCPQCWLKMMARLALFVLKFLVMLYVAYVRTVLAVREWSPA